MKTGFNSTCCPRWELERMLDFAAEHGIDGVELSLGQAPAGTVSPSRFLEDPEHLRRLAADRNVEIACLGSDITLDGKSERDRREKQGTLSRLIEAASRIGAPFVRFNAGRVQRFDNADAALARVAAAVEPLVEPAIRHRVVLLVENGAGFPGSETAWYVTDILDHPAFLCCWNQLPALARGERPTNSLPRLGHKIGLMHVADARFGPAGVEAYTPLGEGQAEVARQVQLLKGLAYDRYLMLHWPGDRGDLPEPERAIAHAHAFLRAGIEEEQEVLTAYKNDPYAPRYAQKRPHPTVAGM